MKLSRNDLRNSKRKNTAFHASPCNILQKFNLGSYFESEHRFDCNWIQFLLSGSSPFSCQELSYRFAGEQISQLNCKTFYQNNPLDFHLFFSSNISTEMFHKNVSRIRINYSFQKWIVRFPFIKQKKIYDEKFLT